MALDDTAVIVPGEGHFYLGDAGATAPTGSGVPDVDDFPEIGHTTYDTGFTLNRDGGDKTVLPSWQASSGVRSRIAPVTYSVNFQPLQWDAITLPLYFGGGAIVSTKFQVPKAPAPQSHSLFIRVVDGADVWPLYLSKVDIIGSDSLEADPENMMGLSVSATILDDAALAYLFTIGIPA